MTMRIGEYNMASKMRLCLSLKKKLNVESKIAPFIADDASRPAATNVG